MKTDESLTEQVSDEAESFTECWERSREEPAGQRFRKLRALRRREESSRPQWLAVANVILAVILIGLGVFFTFVPGPNWLFFVPAFCILATEFGAVARFLDSVEKRAQPLVRSVGTIRKNLHPAVWKGVIVVFGAGFLFISYRFIT